MTDIQTVEAKRPRRSKVDTTSDVSDAASMLADAIAALTPADVQKLNVELTGSHELTVADVMRAASAMHKACQSALKK